MKKSFLITLAAVSSVALIGCSSDSDSGKSPVQNEPKFNIVADKVVAASDYVVNVVTPASDKAKELLGQVKNADEIKQMLSCGAIDKKNIEVEFKETDKVVKIGLKQTELKDVVKCDVTGIVSGIEFSAAKNVVANEAKVLNVSNATNLVDKIEILDGKAQEYNLALEGTVKYTYEQNAFKRTSEADTNTTDVTISASPEDVKGIVAFNCGTTNFTTPGKIAAACKMTVTPVEKDVAGSIAFGKDANTNKESFGSIAVDVKAKPAGSEGDPVALPAAESVKDSHKSSTATKVAEITVPGTVDAAKVKLVCASDATAKATVAEQCLVKEQLYVKEVNKIYFTVESNPAKNFLAISEDNGKTIAVTKALPTTEEFVTATTLAEANNTAVYISATNQSATVEDSALASTPVTTPIAEGKIALGKSANHVTILELKSDNTKKLHKYEVAAQAVKRTPVEAPKLAKELVNTGGTESGNVTVGEGNGQGGKACAATVDAAKNDGSEYLCQVKLTNGGSGITTETNVEIVIKDKKSGETETLTLTGKAAGA